MKIRTLLFFLVAVLPASIVSAQKVSFGVFGGVSHYLGELNNNSFHLEGLHPAAGGLVRYQANPYLGFRLGVTAGTVSGDDAEFPNPTPEQLTRKLMFKSHILEVAFLVELSVFGYDVDDRRFSPFLFAGIAGFNFNPRAFRNGEWHYLQPLRTEGQGTSAYPEREPYSLYQVAFPFGMGFHIGLGSGMTLSLEGGMRYLLTDYLDDVSLTYVDAAVLITELGTTSQEFSNRTARFTGQRIERYNGDPRGNPDDNDWYGFAGFTFTYTLGAGNSRSKKRGCDYGFN